MKQLSLNSIFVITVLSCTGCVSSSISDSVALIEREANSENYRTSNKSVLTSIQALRNSQKIIEPQDTLTDSKFDPKSDRQSYTFVYELHNKELDYDDKIRIVSLVVNKNQTFIINIAPAKGTNTLDQLALSMARAEVLRLYISHFNNKVTIKFAPKLSTDTINLVIGA
ncbi:hypothetical protein CXF85_22190 [Colwellia sp. 75C3]|uniref:hypothetical protein n=1 Tax=Colwellia sp. 75C3 TaxID=888425 RepID=UPI000C334B7A|nr:hypothetical protein [Colwellia sp. 75C3]PKG80819.1 hypothetical protein CXF85_22190 [Colwellia sp. 75C3]